MVFSEAEVRSGELVLGHGGDQGEHGGDPISIDPVADVSEEGAKRRAAVRMRRRSERESEEVVDDEIGIRGAAGGPEVLDELARMRRVRASRAARAPHRGPATGR